MENWKQRDSIIQNLKASGCEDMFIERFLKMLEESDTKPQLDMLQKHREFLLKTYHDDCKKIDCLDFLIYQIAKQRDKGT